MSVRKSYRDLRTEVLGRFPAGVTPGGVAVDDIVQLKVQNTFDTHLDIARAMATVMRADMAAYDADPDRYKNHAQAIGGAMSTIRRTAEATALRILLTRAMKGTVTPVIVLGDLASAQVRRPFVVPWSDSRGPAPWSLTRTAESALQAELAERIIDRVASVEKLRFANSGTEAVMMAVRGARAFTGREKIVKFEGQYHGVHDYALISVGPDDMSELGDPDAPAALAWGRGIPGAVADTIIPARYNKIATLRRIFERQGEEIADGVGVLGAVQPVQDHRAGGGARGGRAARRQRGRRRPGSRAGGCACAAAPRRGRSPATCR